jgi:hypothetical protein
MAKNIFQYVWKLLLSSAVFMVGLILSGTLLPLVGLQPPELPEGADAETISLYFALGSLLFGLALAFLARGLRGSFLIRWLSLSAIMWVAYGINNVIEGAIFSTFSATSTMGSMLYTGLSLLLPSFLQSGVIMALFRSPDAQRIGRPASMERNWAQWVWRLLSAWIAFPVIYYLFGLVVTPLVRDFYSQEQFELALPALSEILMVQLLRSALFLLVSMPIILLWARSRRSFILRLGFALFIFVGGFSMLTTYWFPWQLRVYHGVEIMVDEMVYALVLGLLFFSTKQLAKTGT